MGYHKNLLDNQKDNNLMIIQYEKYLKKKKKWHTEHTSKRQN